MTEPTITVGPASADFPGSDNRAIQAAIEAAAGRGGGTVKVLPGAYLLDDSVHLRSHVRLVGSGAETILRKGPERRTRLVGYLGYGHYDISVAEPDQFAVGMGVTIRDDHAMGFYETVATLTWRDGDRFGIDQMLNHDYSGDQGGEVYTSFAPVSARFVEKVEVRDLAIEGKMAENPHVLNACRGAGVYLIGVKGAVVAGVAVRDLRGEGIGFQQCTGVRVEDCVVENNTGNGLHPGSGSVGAVMKRCRCTGNGGDGLFFCLRATYCLAEGCELIGNHGHGVSIGGRDTNNAIVNCTIERNGAAGIFFRPSDEVMAPHHTLLAGNSLADDCQREEDAEILVPAPVRELRILDNRIARSGGLRPAFGIRLGAEVISASVEGNRFSGELAGETKIECAPGAVSSHRPGRPVPAGPEAAPSDADRHLPPQVRGR